MAAEASLEQAFARAAADYQQGRLADAERELSEIQQRQPGLGGVLHLLALIELRTDRTGEAIRHLEQAVAAEPGSAELFNLLGGALRRNGRAADAVPAYEKAVSLDSGLTEAHYNLGNVLRALDRPEDAVPHYQRAVSLKPDFADAHYNLGLALKEAGRLDDALAAYRDAIAADPGDAEAHVNLGNILGDLGETAEALRSHETAIELKPDFADAHYNLGNALSKMGRKGDAIASYRRALDLAPERADIHTNLADALEKQGEFALAAEHCLLALERDPGHAPALNNLGNAHKKLGDTVAAIDSYRRAIEIDPDYASAITNLGNALMEAGDFDEGVSHHRRAIEIEPDHVDAHTHLGLALLLQGRLQEGWTEYEWRWRTDDCEKARDFPQAPWQGTDADGKTLLVVAEQGVGEEVMFAGMVPDLVDAGARVVLESDPRLVPLFERSFPGVRCVAKEDPPASAATAATIDFQIPAGNLGRWLRPDLDAFPGRASYLVADGDKRDALRDRYLDGGGDLLLGVAWLSKNEKIGKEKSMTLIDLRPLADIPGVKFIDLQYGDTGAERRAFEAETGTALLHDGGVDQMADLDAFAAQVAAMDLIVSVSNTTVHVSGALGVPTWVMLNTVPLPVWMLERNDSPWYPPARLFRQRERGRWADVIERVAGELAALAQG